MLSNSSSSPKSVHFWLVPIEFLSLTYLTTFTAWQRKGNVLAMKSPENRAVRNERKTHVTHPRELIGCKGWKCALDKRPCKKYIWERHFSNHRNVWKVKTSWLDRVQDTQKRETANHTQNWKLHSSRTQKCFEKNRFSLEKKWNVIVVEKRNAWLCNPFFLKHSQFRVSLFSFQSSGFWIACDPLLISLQWFISLYEVLRSHVRWYIGFMQQFLLGACMWWKHLSPQLIAYTGLKTQNKPHGNLPV